MTQITAELAETFRWIEYAQLRGFVFQRAGVRLHGMITIHLDDVASSFATSWQRYISTNPTVHYGDELDNKGNRTIRQIEWGAFSDLTMEEAALALIPHVSVDDGVELLAVARLSSTNSAVEVPVESL